jgi:hypothetical protein
MMKERYPVEGWLVERMRRKNGTGSAGPCSFFFRFMMRDWLLGLGAADEFFFSFRFFL